MDWQQTSNDIQQWLNQPLPTFWLFVAISIALLVYALRTRYLKKLLSRTNEDREQLAIEQSANRKEIEQLGLSNRQLNDQTCNDSTKIANLLTESAQLKASRDEKAEQLAKNEHERLGLREQHENDQRKLHRLEQDMRETQAHFDAEKAKLAEQKQEFERQKNELKNEFKVVSEEVIKERQRMLAEQNKEGVGALLKPLQAQLDQFQQRVNQVHDESVKGQTSLKKEIENVLSIGLKMRDEASNLTTALKGDSQQRGAWGEAQLERTLELSGLIQHDHYEKQSAFVDDNGKRKQTDYLIKLPDDKCIIIDSKVSLVAYERASSAETVEEQQLAMKQHVTAVRKHIDDLAGKEYTNLSALHSPDFILMFMPIEPAYIEAMKQDPELFGYGYAKNVILVSHTTVIPILRTVANLWMLDRSNKEARQLGERANDIYNSVALVSDRLLSLGKTLNTVGKHYNQAVTAVSGTQGLQGKVRRFTELSSKASKEMPELEHRHIEFEVGKLEAEPIAIENIDPEADENNQDH